VVIVSVAAWAVWIKHTGARVADTRITINMITSAPDLECNAMFSRAIIKVCMVQATEIALSIAKVVTIASE
jgi:hypothetical protein